MLFEEFQSLARKLLKYLQISRAENLVFELVDSFGLVEISRGSFRTGCLLKLRLVC